MIALPLESTEARLFAGEKTQLAEALDQRIHIRIEQRNARCVSPDRGVGRVAQSIHRLKALQAC